MQINVLTDVKSPATLLYLKNRHLTISSTDDRQIRHSINVDGYVNIVGYYIAGRFFAQYDKGFQLHGMFRRYARMGFDIKV